MFFYIKRKEIVLDCFTDMESQYHLFPIDYSTNYYPDWFNSSPKEITLNGFIPQSTIKRCKGILDLYKNSLTIPLWSDLNIWVQDFNYGWQFADGVSQIIVHPQGQWEFFCDPNIYGHMKIESRWNLKTKNDIKFLAINPFWNEKINKQLYQAHGILDFKYNHSTSPTFFIDKTINNIISLKANQPLYHLIPMTESKIIIKTHLIDSKELIVYGSYPSFTHKYRNLKNLMIKKEKKCPFGFK